MINIQKKYVCSQENLFFVPLGLYQHFSYQTLSKIQNKMTKQEAKMEVEQKKKRKIIILLLYFPLLSF